MTFWYGSGSGSVDPYLWLTDPYPVFLSVTFKMAIKNNFFVYYFLNLNRRNEGFFLLFLLDDRRIRSRIRTVPSTNGSGKGGPKNIRIQIRIPDNGYKSVILQINTLILLMWLSKLLFQESFESPAFRWKGQTKFIPYLHYLQVITVCKIIYWIYLLFCFSGVMLKCNLCEYKNKNAASLRMHRQCCSSGSLSNELNKRAPWISSTLSIIGRVHIGARALHVLNLIGMVWLHRSPIPVGRRG
jgi:hypothetical protein